MSISFVNGYLCTNCADEAKARRGVDPHPSPIKDAQEAAKADRAAGRDKLQRADEPAVVFGGALAAVKGADDVSAAGAVSKAPISPSATSQKVDFYA